MHTETKETMTTQVDDLPRSSGDHKRPRGVSGISLGVHAVFNPSEHQNHLTRAQRGTRAGAQKASSYQSVQLNEKESNIYATIDKISPMPYGAHCPRRRRIPCNRLRL